MRTDECFRAINDAIKATTSGAMSAHRESPYRVGGRYRPTKNFTSTRDVFRTGEVLTFVQEGRRDEDAVTSYTFSDERGTVRTLDVPDDMPTLAHYLLLRAVEARDGGCPECRRAALKDMGPPLREHAREHGPVIFYHCGRCRALWEKNRREGHIVWDRLLTCPHLQPLEHDLRATGVGIEWEGKHDERRGFWIYFDVRIDQAAVQKRYRFPECVEYDEYDGRAAGAAAGFQCSQCESAIQGVHPSAVSGHPTFPTAMNTSAPKIRNDTRPSATLPDRSLIKDVMPIVLLATAFTVAIASGWWAGKRP